MKTLVGAAVISDNKLLLVQREGEVWTIPDVRYDGTESEIQCLSDAVESILSGTRLKEFVFYDAFIGRSRDAQNPFVARIYCADVHGFVGAPSGSARRKMWYDSTKKVPLSDVTEKLVEKLGKERYLR
jgi:hypothetical protein